jgi:PEP-CTERM motif
MTFSKTIIAAGLIGAASSSFAVTNGSFANGLSGWTTLGDVSVSAGAVSLTTASVLFEDDFPAGAGAFNLSGSEPGDIASLEAFVGVAPYGLDLPVGNFATEGSAFKQTFNVNAGDVLSFVWVYSTNEAGPNANRDYAFITLNGSFIEIAAGNAVGGVTTGFGYTGPLTLAFGVVDINDFVTSSTLTISNVVLTPVPEPITLALWAAGLGLVGGLKARRR